MEHWKKQAVSFLTSLALLERADPSVIPHTPSGKTVGGVPVAPHPSTSPCREGLSGEHLGRLLDRLEVAEGANVHALYLLKDGRCVLSCARAGYDVQTPYLAHSMAKSVIGLLVGLAVDEGRLSLSDRLTSFFPELRPRDGRFAEITVEHLLSMRAGVTFGEAGVVTERSWARAFFSSSMSAAPDRAFLYNSMNSYMLGRIVERVMDEDLFSLCERRLFHPLGITDAFWERDPEGYVKGGFGLFLSAVSWARLGELILGRGCVRGVRLISEDWIEQMCAVHSTTPESLGEYHYGYHIWVSREGDDVLMNGMLGQNVWICPHRGTVAVLLSGNADLFQQSPALTVLREELLRPGDGRVGRRQDRRLARRASRFFEATAPVRPRPPKGSLLHRLLGRARPFDGRWEPLLGTYRFATGTASLFPLLMRLLQNVYDAEGIGELTFARDGERLLLELRHGTVTYRVPVGLYGHAESVQVIGGEPYIVRALGAVEQEPTGSLSYRIELLFPELPNERHLHICPLLDGRVRIDLTEQPDQRLLHSFEQSLLADEGRTGFLRAQAERLLGGDSVHELLARLFSPTLWGVDARAADADDFLAALERAREERLGRQSSLVRLIRYLVPEASDADEPSLFRRMTARLGLGRRRGPDADPTEELTPAPTDGETGDGASRVDKADAVCYNKEDNDPDAPRGGSEEGDTI